MDPNANLREQEDLQIQLWDEGKRIDYRRRTELRVALRDWLNHGGFAPDWEKYPQAARAFQQWVDGQQWLNGVDDGGR